MDMNNQEHTTFKLSGVLKKVLFLTKRVNIVLLF